MTNIFSLDSINPVYVHTGIVVLVIVGIFAAVALLRAFAGWVKGPSQRSAYGATYAPKLSRGARKSLERDGIKPVIKKYNSTYRSTRNRTVHW